MAQLAHNQEQIAQLKYQISRIKWELLYYRVALRIQLCMSGPTPLTDAMRLHIRRLLTQRNDYKQALSYLRHVTSRVTTNPKTPSQCYPTTTTPN